MTRDHDRRQVYIAEDASLVDTAFTDAPGADVLADALSEVFRTPWWNAIVGVSARVTFADNQGTGFYRHGELRIHLGRTARWLVAAHELAHMAAAHDACRPHDGPAHDDRFCGWEVVAFDALFGAQTSDLLAGSFRSMGIGVVLPLSDVPLPRPPIWDRYVHRDVRGGWQPPGPAATATLGDDERDPIPLRGALTGSIPGHLQSSV